MVTKVGVALLAVGAFVASLGEMVSTSLHVTLGGGRHATVFYPRATFGVMLAVAGVSLLAIGVIRGRFRRT